MVLANIKHLEIVCKLGDMIGYLKIFICINYVDTQHTLPMIIFTLFLQESKVPAYLRLLGNNMVPKPCYPKPGSGGPWLYYSRPIALPDIYHLLTQM